ncbi:MAG: hypothetical protein ACI9QD_000818 [Thermoproteota archaeon]|jgi:hypothetical protein
MKKSSIFLVPMVLMSLSFAQASDLGVGRIIKTGKNKLSVQINGALYDLSGKRKLLKFTRSFDEKRSFFRIFGEQKGKTINISKVPQIVSGDIELNGRISLDKDKNLVMLDEAGNNYNASYIKAVNYYGNNFDELSIDHYMNKSVRTLGQIIDGNYIISAIVEKDLYSASQTIDFTLDINQKTNFENTPKNYIMNEMNTNQMSQDHPSFRKSVLGKSVKLKKGDKALVVTLAGRQGDDLTAAGGHFAIGTATVNSDMSLEMEISNFYPKKNLKDIIPGHIHHLDYFSGISSGQTNYRPQYTLVVYGDVNSEMKNKLSKMRSRLDRTFNHMRSSKDSGGVNNNCTTASWKGLRAMGIKGLHNRGIKNLRKILKIVNPLYFLGAKGWITRELSYVLANSTGEFIPRNAFNSFIGDLKSIGAKRIDFIFQAQVPSKRPEGGAAFDETNEYTWTAKMEKVRLEQDLPVEWVKEELDKNID